MKKLLLFSVVVSFFLSLYSAEKFIVRFDNPQKNFVKKLAAENYDISAYNPEKYLDIIASETEMKKLRSSGYEFNIITSEEQVKQNLEKKRDLVGYRNYEQFLSDMQAIAADYPSICHLYDIGDSWGKIYSDDGNSNYDDFHHEIWAMKVSDNVETEEDEPAVFYLGEHHAREPISLEVAMADLNYIVENYGSDPTITENVNNTQIWFVPLVNPNGHRIVTSEYDVWWRKNIRDNNENGQFDDDPNEDGPDGVDPNRNYGWEWGNVGASDNWNSQTYHGPNAWSEPEIQAVKALIDAHHFVAGISYHSYSELVLFPFGYNNNVIAPDHDALQELAVNMANVLPADDGGHYTPQESWQLYPCMGTSDDYFYGEHGIFSYTIEIGTEFIPPASQVDQICQNHLEAAMILLDRVNHSTLTGHITNSETGQPLVAEISIPDIDDSGVYRNPYVSDEQFGRYYRLLENGSYSVTFSAYGYESQTVDNVSINGSGQTVLDIQLSPVGFTEIEGMITAQTGNPISGAEIEILNTPLEPVYTDENGEYSIPEIYYGDFQMRVSAEGYATIIDNITVSETNTQFNFEMTTTVYESFENGVFGPGWSFSGNADWFIDPTVAYDGNFSARSGNVSSWGSSRLLYSMNVAWNSEISFYVKTSSENSYDFLKFYIDETQVGQWSGETDWTMVSFSVSAGVHSFQWSYEKDGAVDDGQDCGWIDYVVFPPLAVSTDEETISESPVLLGNYPNPFRTSTTISFEFSTEQNQQNEQRTISIYNIKGQRIKQLEIKNYDLGINKIIWNGKDESGKSVNSGIYFFKIKDKDNKFTSVKKMILMK